MRQLHAHVSITNWVLLLFSIRLCSCFAVSTSRICWQIRWEVTTANSLLSLIFFSMRLLAEYYSLKLEPQEFFKDCVFGLYHSSRGHFSMRVLRQDLLRIVHWLYFGLDTAKKTCDGRLIILCTASLMNLFCLSFCIRWSHWIVSFSRRTYFDAGLWALTNTARAAAVLTAILA